MRSSVTLKQYMYEIRHEVNQTKKTDLFPDGLLFKWIHKDICETILRLGGLVNQLYRTISTVALATGAGAYDADVSHTASSVTITGFSGLVPDAWIGGSIITVKTNVIYCAQITDNDATTITISVGTDLPALSGDPAFLTANNSSVYAPLTGLGMINFSEPIWEVLDGSGNPIEFAPLERARNVKNDPMHDDEAYCYLVGQNLYFAIGADKTLSGNVDIGYYALPTEADDLTEYIDFPIEWHDLAQQRTIIRVLKKADMYEKAQEKEADLEKRWQDIEQSNIKSRQLDQYSGERG